MIKMAPDVKNSSNRGFLAAVGIAFACVAAVLLCTGTMDFLLSFKNSGSHGSKWVGFVNYQWFFSWDYQGFQPYLRFLAYPAVSSGLLFLLSVPIGYLLLVLKERPWLRHALCTLLLLPLAIPPVAWLLALVMPITSYLPDTDYELASMIQAALWGAIKHIGIPALLADAAISRTGSPRSVPILSAGFVSLASFVLLGWQDYGYLQRLNPVYTVDVLTFRFMDEAPNPGLASAGQVIRTAASFLLLLAAAVPLARMARRLFPQPVAPDHIVLRKRIFVSAVLLALLLAAGIILYVTSLPHYQRPGFSTITTRLLLYQGIAFLAAGIGSLVCFLLASPAVCWSGKKRTVYIGILLFLTAISIRPLSTGFSALFDNSMFAYHSFWGNTAALPVPLWGAWILALAGWRKGIDSFSQWKKDMCKPAIVLAAFTAVLMAGDPILAGQYNIHVFYDIHAVGYGPVTDGLLPPFDELNKICRLFALSISAAPVLLLLAIRTWIGGKGNHGLSLPGR